VVDVPVSGFFLPTKNVAGTDVYVDFMKKAYTLHNASSMTVDTSCAAAHKGQEWHCMFAPFSMLHMKTPVFPLQSMYDSWQMGNEYFINVPQDSVCANNGPANCSSSQIKDVNKFGASLIAMMQSGLGPNRSSGAFVHSCWTHCLAYTSQGLDSQGLIQDVSMQQAVTAWYNSPTTQSKNVHVDCTLSGSHKCNPTCPA